MSYDNEIDSLPPQLQDIVERELEDDEELIWIGQPIPVYFTASSIGAVLFAIPWTLFALFWICAAADFQIPQKLGLEMLFPLFGVPFVLIGLAMFCSPFFTYRSLKKTVYAITNQRAIVFAGTFFSTQIVSFAPDELGKLQRKEKANGSGDVLFQNTSLVDAAEQGTELVSTKGFLNIPQAKEVERLLKDLVASAPQISLEEAKEFEQTQLADLPQLLQIGEAPRYLPLSTRLYLRLCSGSMPSLFGWFFGGFGLLFALIAAGIVGLDDTIPRNWIDAGKGKITNVEATNMNVGGKKHGGGGQKIYAYHFSVNDQPISGISYGFNGKYNVGDDVTIQKSGNRYKIHNLTLTGVPVLAPLVFFGMGSLFGMIGLCFPIGSWFAGGKSIPLLQDGIAIGAKYVGMNPTGTKINDRSVMKVDFEYQVDGETYTASAQALDTSRLTDSKYKVVLYDPMEPKRSVVLDGLPSGIHLDEMSGQFSANPLRVVLPLFASAIVGAEIVAIVVFAIRAI